MFHPEKKPNKLSLKYYLEQVMLQYDNKINTSAVYSNTAVYSITNIKLNYLSTKMRLTETLGYLKFLKIYICKVCYFSLVCLLKCYYKKVCNCEYGEIALTVV